jgi:hypothetical protein
MPLVDRRCSADRDTVAELELGNTEESLSPGPDRAAAAVTVTVLTAVDDEVSPVP